MPEGSSCDDLRSALRKRFRLTPEAYRRKFREARKEGNETFFQFGVRLSKSLNYWLSLADVSSEDLVLMEQLKNNVTGELSIYITEGKPASFAEAIATADCYAEARRSETGGRPPPRNRGSNPPGMFRTGMNDRPRQCTTGLRLTTPIR
eukprot:TRINITY_DN95429_c0_g1_i1.p1 TRINITY_DN95429_c0_g1~~TRINITY_DN95429_c0_g1_i1.p1  ORF type:complete len:149 (-),score=18.56 TRINITY_DN95429_c0_g1_i1:573-1019(-)